MLRKTDHAFVDVGDIIAAVIESLQSRNLPHEYPFARMDQSTHHMRSLETHVQERLQVLLIQTSKLSIRLDFPIHPSDTLVRWCASVRLCPVPSGIVERFTRFQVVLCNCRVTRSAVLSSLGLSTRTFCVLWVVRLRAAQKAL